MLDAGISAGHGPWQMMREISADDAHGSCDYAADAYRTAAYQ